jgi:hypothetical protein
VAQLKAVITDAWTALATRATIIQPIHPLNNRPLASVMLLLHLQFALLQLHHSRKPNKRSPPKQPIDSVSTTSTGWIFAAQPALLSLLLQAMSVTGSVALLVLLSLSTTLLPQLWQLAPLSSPLLLLYAQMCSRMTGVVGISCAPSAAAAPAAANDTVVASAVAAAVSQLHKLRITSLC